MEQSYILGAFFQDQVKVVVDQKSHLQILRAINRFRRQFNLKERVFSHFQGAWKVIEGRILNSKNNGF